MPNTQRTAVCPGTYDPPTLGHLDVIRRAARNFDKVIVGVVRAPRHKEPLFTDDERVEFLEQLLTDLPNVAVKTFSNLVVEFARSEGATVLVKGLRAISDFEWEFQMSLLNSSMAPDIDTMYLMSSPKYSFVSSSGVREVASFGGDVSAYVSPQVNARLVEIFSS
jgi:pantetheine-phosphate adenylyltransferase